MIRKDLGSAHNGLHDWYWQRLSAVVLILLLPFPVFLIVGAYSGGLDQLTFLDWADHFLFRLFHTILILGLLTHAFVGLKVIIEDYLHTPKLRIPVIGAMLLGVIGFAIWWMALIWAWGG